MKNFFINFIIFFFSFILFIILLETFARYKKPSWHEFSQDLGWELKKNFSHIYKNKDIFGNIYLSKIETDELGFRTHGNKNSKIKILVIGDSFTADPYSANDKMWYSILANEVKKKIKQNVFVYAGGGGGYGTLQEYLLLKKINEKIDYNLFILQFCGNDYGNNTYEAEKNSLLLNQTYKRPYIDISNGNIFYNPNILGKIFRNPILGESKIYNKILFYYSILYKKYFNHYKNEAINEEDLKKKTIEITDYLLKEIRKLVKSEKAYMVNCEPDNSLWADLAKKNNFIPLIKANLEIAKNRNKNIFNVDGGHYNDLGNQIYGDSIYREIIKIHKFN